MKPLLYLPTFTKVTHKVEDTYDFCGMQVDMSDKQRNIAHLYLVGYTRISRSSVIEVFLDQ